MARIENTISKISSDVQRFWENQGIKDHASKREFQYFRLDGTEKPAQNPILKILEGYAELAEVAGRAPVNEEAKGKTVASMKAVGIDGILGLAYAAMRSQHLESLYASNSLPRPPKVADTVAVPVEIVKDW